MRQSLQSETRIFLATDLIIDPLYPLGSLDVHSGISQEIDPGQVTERASVNHPQDSRGEHQLSTGLTGSISAVEISSLKLDPMPGSEGDGVGLSVNRYGARLLRSTVGKMATSENETLFPGVTAVAFVAAVNHARRGAVVASHEYAPLLAEYYTDLATVASTSSGHENRHLHERLISVRAFPHQPSSCRNRGFMNVAP
jgi:hypothetical protein